MKRLLGLSFFIVLYAMFLFFADLSFEFFNFFEAIFWAGIGLWTTMYFLFFAKEYVRFAYVFVVIFMIFGLTDVIEVYTGAFWHPWWLLALNIFCVISFFIILFLFAIKKYRNNE